MRESKYSHYENAFASEPTVEQFYRVEKVDRNDLNAQIIKSEEVFDEETNTIRIEKSFTYNHEHLATIHLKLEDRLDMFEVSSYTVSEMIEEMGGFYSLIFDIVIVLVGIISQEEFWGSLIEALFRTKRK